MGKAHLVTLSDVVEIYPDGRSNKKKSESLLMTKHLVSRATAAIRLSASKVAIA